MARAAILTLLGTLCAALLAVWWLTRANASLQAETAALSRAVAALEGQADQARLAATVARAEAERHRARAADYDALRRTLLTGDDDADLPDWFRAWLDDLLGGL